MNVEMKEIGKRIRQIRDRYSLEEFEKIIGITKSTLSLYERGEGSPRAIFLWKLAEFGGVTVDWILTGREPKTPLVREQGETYNPGDKTDEEIMNDHLEQLIEGLEKQGVERVIAEKILETAIQEAKIRGKGPDGFINLGEYLKDYRRRGEKEAAHQGQAAEGELKNEL